MAEAGIGHSWIGTDLVVHDRHEDTADALLAAIERRHGLDSDAPGGAGGGERGRVRPVRVGQPGARHAHRPAHRGRRALPLGGWSARGHRGGRGPGGRRARRRRRRARRRRWHAAERGGAGREPAVGALRRRRRPGRPSQRPRHHPPPERAVRAERGRPGALRRQPVLVGADPRPGVGPARPLARRRGRRRRQGRGRSRSARSCAPWSEPARPGAVERGGPLP